MLHCKILQKLIFWCYIEVELTLSTVHNTKRIDWVKEQMSLRSDSPQTESGKLRVHFEQFIAINTATIGTD